MENERKDAWKNKVTVQIANPISERRHITRDPANTKRIMKKHHEQVYAHNFNNLKRSIP